MKRLVALILVCMTLLSCVGSAVAADINTLEITDIELSSSTVSTEESVDVQVSYVDNGFNASYGEIEFISVESPEKKIECKLNVTPEDNFLRGSFCLNKYYPGGKYELEWIAIYNDNGECIGGEVGNFTIPTKISELFSGLGFTYLNESEADILAPEITSVAINGTVFKAGDALTITIGFIEAGSGFDGAAAHFVNEDTMKEAFQIWPIYLDEDGFARGTFILPDYLESGNYQLSYISISDKADNHGVLEVRMPFQSENLAGAEKCNFQLTSPGSPDESNKKIGITDITLSKNNVGSGDVIDVYITGESEFGELKNYSYGNEIKFEETGTNRAIRIPLTNTDDPKVLKAEIMVDSNTIPGEYVLATYDIYAQYGQANYYAGRFYLYDLAEQYKFLSFTVDGERPTPEGSEGTGILDTRPPQIESVTVNKTAITAPDSAIVTVTFKDDFSGIANAEACFRDANDIEKNITLYCKDGNVWEGSFSTNEFSAESIFYLEYIFAKDGAGNGIQVGATPRQGRAILPQAYRNVKIKIINSNQDAEAPIFKDVSFRDMAVIAPGQQEIIVDAVDSVSGISVIEVGILRRVSSTTFVTDRVRLENAIYNNKTGIYEPYEDGKWHGFIDISQFAKGQTRYLDYIYMEDNAGNYKYYTSSSAEESYQELLPVGVRYLNFDVINANGDSCAPTLEDITFSSNSIKAPGYVEVMASITDDVSGVKSAHVTFINYNTGISVSSVLSDVYYSAKTGEMIPYEDGLWHGTLHFGQYCASGTYYFDAITVQDYAGNVDDYWANLPSYYGNSHLPEKFNKLGIKITNPDDWADVSTSTTSATLIQDITNSNNDAHIVINYSENAEISEKVFDAIRGTERTLEFIADGIKWTFKGPDITNPKKINLSIFYNTTVSDIDAKDSLFSKLLEDKDCVFLHFADNGVLPGKAVVSIKADYAMRKYLGTNGLYVYYINKSSGRLEPVASNVEITDDFYIEFDITHCSDYVITNEDILTIPRRPCADSQLVSANTDVASPKTADTGVALYLGLSVSSLIGMGYIRKKRSV